MFEDHSVECRNTEKRSLPCMSELNEGGRLCLTLGMIITRSPVIQSGTKAEDLSEDMEKRTSLNYDVFRRRCERGAHLQLGPDRFQEEGMTIGTPFGFFVVPPV